MYVHTTVVCEGGGQGGQKKHHALLCTPSSFLNFKPKQQGPVNAKPTRHVAICCMPQTAIAFQPLRNERKPRIMLRI